MMLRSIYLLGRMILLQTGLSGANICHRVRGDFGHAEGMARHAATSRPAYLVVPGGAALYIGALLGPGLLLLPGLAAAQAGPASILAWLGLLGLSGLLAVVFTALGTRLRPRPGWSGYAAAGLGPRAGRRPAGASWPAWSAAPRSSASSARATSPT